MMGEHPFHAVGEKYIKAIAEGADCTPFLIPVLPDPLDLEEIFDAVDGIFLTGSWSNVQPSEDRGEPSGDGTLPDAKRAALAQAITRRTV